MSIAAHSVQLLVLERREPAANMARFYVLSLEETLFGDTAVVREWGRLGTMGYRRLDLYQARAQASEALESWLNRKLRRGYEMRGSRRVISGRPMPPAVAAELPARPWASEIDTSAGSPEHRAWGMRSPHEATAEASRP